MMTKIKTFLHGDPIAGSWSDILSARDGAWFSYPDLNYRTLLWRTFEGEASRNPPLVFCMLNPSRANHKYSDPTIRRCLGFAQREKAGGILVVNLATFCTENPKTLQIAHRAGLDVFLREHNAHAWKIAQGFGKMIAAWGAGGIPYLEHLEPTVSQGIDWYCLGTTKHGHPRHPLYLLNDAPLMPWPPSGRSKKISERCGELYCLCSGGRHVACNVGNEKDQATRNALLALSEAFRSK